MFKMASENLGLHELTSEKKKSASLQKTVKLA